MSKRSTRICPVCRRSHSIEHFPLVPGTTRRQDVCQTCKEGKAGQKKKVILEIKPDMQPGAARIAIAKHVLALMKTNKEITISKKVPGESLDIRGGDDILLDMISRGYIVAQQYEEEWSLSLVAAFDPHNPLSASWSPYVFSGLEIHDGVLILKTNNPYAVFHAPNSEAVVVVAADKKPPPSVTKNREVRHALNTVAAYFSEVTPRTTVEIAFAEGGRSIALPKKERTTKTVLSMLDSHHLLSLMLKDWDIQKMSSADFAEHAAKVLNNDKINKDHVEKRRNQLGLTNYNKATAKPAPGTLEARVAQLEERIKFLEERLKDIL